MSSRSKTVKGHHRNTRIQCLAVSGSPFEIRSRGGTTPKIPAHLVCNDGFKITKAFCSSRTEQKEIQPGQIVVSLWILTQFPTSPNLQPWEFGFDLKRLWLWWVDGFSRHRVTTKQLLFLQRNILLQNKNFRSFSLFKSIVSLSENVKFAVKMLRSYPWDTSFNLSVCFPLCCCLTPNKLHIWGLSPTEAFHPCIVRQMSHTRHKTLTKRKFDLRFAFIVLSVNLLCTFQVNCSN